MYVRQYREGWYEVKLSYWKLPFITCSRLDVICVIVFGTYWKNLLNVL